MTKKVYKNKNPKDSDKFYQDGSKFCKGTESRNKNLDNALKSKNIDLIMRNLEDEDYDEESSFQNHYYKYK